MNSEDDVFLKQMKGVSPIKKKNRVKKEESKKNLKHIEKNNTKNKNNEFHILDKKIISSEFGLEKADLKKSIKKGSIKIDKKIDFHGKTLIESKEIFENTILKCYTGGQRCLLFVTGKGLFKTKNNESSNRPKLYYGVIRSAFVEWAKSKNFSKHILSFEQASLKHGGDGAFYVYLRKNKN